MKLSSCVRMIPVTLICLFGTSGVAAQDVNITINPKQDKKEISPNIYGRNNTFDKAPSFYKDAGLRFVRMNGGNNATKYNWRRKISSHPDWYNNVYVNNWDETSEYIAANHPEMQVMWAFQLLGRVASGTNYNFNDWGFNGSQWWQGVNQNLAGGGVPNTVDPSGKALVEGDMNLYTMEWPADSTVEILNHWFGENGLGFDKNQFAYWSMDNEPDIWNGTHDDVMGTLLSASDFLDRFIEVSKKARALFPEIKICGPVTTSEWQWYVWGEERIWIDGKYYSWLEYFLKRIADEENSSGTRLLDVVDLHNYPYAPSTSDALQVHRMYYDKSYVYPGANGVKTIDGGWDTSQTKEYIFQRIEDWLTEYFGEDHGITLGLSEWGPSASDPNVCSVAYGSLLGTFARQGVEFFTPWYWEKGMWETLHLFSCYSHVYSVSSISSLENTVSAYATVNGSADSMTVILVNRDMNNSRNVTVNINSFLVEDGNYRTLQISSLPSAETFISHTENALEENTLLVGSNSFTLSLPSLSTTAVLLKGQVTGIALKRDLSDGIRIFPNPASDKLFVDVDAVAGEQVKVRLYDLSGRKIQSEKCAYYDLSPLSLDVSELPVGIYTLSVELPGSTSFRTIAVIR